MKEPKYELPKGIETQVDLLTKEFITELHQLGLGEVAGEDQRFFDFRSLGLKANKRFFQKKGFKFQITLEFVREMIKSMEKSLEQSGEEAWAMPERENGKYLEACFSGLDNIENEKDLFATLVFRLTKNHPCEDGNKRISSMLFILGLLQNGLTVKQIKQVVNLEEFGMVSSQWDNRLIDMYREKIKLFLTNIGF